jgi:hypothetical protein
MEKVMSKEWERAWNEKVQQQDAETQRFLMVFKRDVPFRGAD